MNLFSVSRGLEIVKSEKHEVHVLSLRFLGATSPHLANVYVVCSTQVSISVIKRNQETLLKKLIKG